MIYQTDYKIKSAAQIKNNYKKMLTMPIVCDNINKPL